MIEQAVKEKLHSYTTEQCYLILNEIEANTELGRLWLDKLRRYVSLHGSKIYKKAKLSFPIETKLHLRWITKCLQAGLKNNQNDQALISALLYLSRFASSAQRKEIFTNCIQLERWLLKTKPIQLFLKLRNTTLQQYENWTSRKN